MAKTLTGVVISDVADKTITVAVISRETHPIYKKQYTVTRKYAAHDENNDARKGDTVRIVETRPISKRKSFTLDRIEKRSVGSVELKEEVNAEVSDKVDHDHDTGYIRGLLCSSCNKGVIGHLRDSVETLQRAITYLEDPPAQQVIGKRVAPQ